MSTVPAYVYSSSLQSINANHFGSILQLDDGGILGRTYPSFSHHSLAHFKQNTPRKFCSFEYKTSHSGVPLQSGTNVAHLHNLNFSSCFLIFPNSETCRTSGKLIFHLHQLHIMPVLGRSTIRVEIMPFLHLSGVVLEVVKISARITFIRATDVHAIGGTTIKALVAIAITSAFKIITTQRTFTLPPQSACTPLAAHHAPAFPCLARASAIARISQMLNVSSMCASSFHVSCFQSARRRSSSSIMSKAFIIMQHPFVPLWTSFLRFHGGPRPLEELTEHGIRLHWQHRARVLHIHHRHKIHPIRAT